MNGSKQQSAVELGYARPDTPLGFNDDRHLPSVSKPKGRTREFALLGATLLICLMVAEALTRAVVPAPLPWNWPQVKYEPSQSLGFRPVAGQVSFTADKPVRTNALGLRGPERTFIKPDGVRRILILGDSVAFGHGVAYEDTFANKLEVFLNGEGRGRHEVIDAGVPAFNTLQEVTYFREEGVRLNPDVAVLALYWNDVSSKAGVTADAAGRLVDDATPPNSGRFRQWEETASGYWVRNLLKRFSFLYFVVDRIRYLRDSSGRSTPKQAAMQMSVLTGNAHPAVNAGWGEIERQLVILADACRSRGTALIVAILPMPQLLEGHYPNAQYPKEAIRLCGKYRLQCVDMQPAFEREFKGHSSLFIPYDGDHPNEKGHLVIARQLYEALRSSGTP